MIIHFMISILSNHHNRLPPFSFEKFLPDRARFGRRTFFPQNDFHLMILSNDFHLVKGICEAISRIIINILACVCARRGGSAGIIDIGEMIWVNDIIIPVMINMACHSQRKTNQCQSSYLCIAFCRDS